MSAARVFLVGAGPGALGLMTVRAMELVARADVILYDKLIPDGALDGARPDADLVDVGKIGGGEQVPQEVTRALILEHAQAGQVVVRLKGGDPFVFGRGGEEAQLLAEHGIAYEVVPGVTSGVAAPAYAGIPVTQRGMSAAVAIVTGHEDPRKGGGGSDSIDWPALAAFPGTLTLYMGVKRLDRIARRLVESGRPETEPVAVVQRGTFADQRVVTGTLADIAGRAEAAQIQAPAIIVVGPVAALHDQLRWFAPGPLAGRSVAVTRARAQSSALARTLRDLGARVIEAPTIRTEPLAAELPDLGAYDLLCVTSPNGALRLLQIARDARALAGPLIAAIGPGTARALRAGGIEPDVVPDRAVAEGLVEALEGVEVRRALIARADRAREVLPDALRARGAEVDVLALYRTVNEMLDPALRDEALAADYLTFTSASGVRSFLEAAGSVAGPRLASIGPITSAALREQRIEPDVEAVEHTPEGLVAALVADAACGRISREFAAGELPGESPPGDSP